MSSPKQADVEEKYQETSTLKKSTSVTKSRSLNLKTCTFGEKRQICTKLYDYMDAKGRRDNF